MITPTHHEKMEWARMAQAAYGANLNDIGHRFSVAATLRSGEHMDLQRFDSLQNEYREWLTRGTFRLNQIRGADSGNWTVLTRDGARVYVCEAPTAEDALQRVRNCGGDALSALPGFCDPDCAAHAA